MFGIRYANVDDIPFWRTLDTHIRAEELLRKIQGERALIISAESTPVGVLRYNLFWDIVPFLTFIHLLPEWRGKGFGKKALLFWEGMMRAQGYTLLMTSTQVDEPAQHFYRKLGYIDRGALFLDDTPFAQPQEVLMLKKL